MRLAVSPTIPVGAGHLVEVCRRAEDMGYEWAWLSEVAGPEAFSLAGAVATATKRMDIGVAVVAAATRTPALNAMGIGTVSQLLDGRTFAYGIGSSSEVIVEQWHGKIFASPLGQVRDAVLGTRASLEGDPEYLGASASMRRFRLGSPPLGPVPLYVGALGPRMLALAGEIADGVCLNLMPPAAVPRQLAEIARGAELRGGIPEDFDVMARFHLVVDDDIDAARAVIRHTFGPYFAQPVYNRFLAWCGFPKEAEAILSGFATRDRDAVAAAMTDDVVDAVSLVGPLERVQQRLTEFADAGVTTAALNVIASSAEEIAGVLGDLR
ncbi:MAG: LLM class flavin-dependent oxidoreductase [Acidimicrobiia bacterium]|nr:LLM class flavin-dependent oxidoreductase [Acidimicrobiia bacterium]